MSKIPSSSFMLSEMLSGRLEKQTVPNFKSARTSEKHDGFSVLGSIPSRIFITLCSACPRCLHCTLSVTCYLFL